MHVEVHGKNIVQDKMKTHTLRNNKEGRKFQVTFKGARNKI